MRIFVGKLVFSFFLIGLGFAGFCVAPVFAGTPAATQSAVIASPASIPADGTTTSTITVTLKDASGTPLAGDSVNIQAENDLTQNIIPATTTLNASGQGSFTFSSKQVGTDLIDVTDLTSNVTLTALGQVQITVVSSSPPSTSSSGGGSSTSGNNTPSCNALYPSGAPNLYAVFKNSNHTSVTLYFVPPPLPYDGFTISYGLSAAADSYAVSFSQGQSSGAIKYTVNSLIKDAPYYFRVRANNGCAAGPWSNVKTASSAVTSLPKTGPNNFFITMGLVGLLSVLSGVAVFFAF